MGGQNYQTDLSAFKQQSWKSKYKNTYVVYIKPIISLEVLAHDLEACGGKILEKWNVLHGIVAEFPAGRPKRFWLSEQFIDKIEQKYDLNALHC